MPTIKFPSVRVKLSGEDGNAFFIMARVRKALLRGSATEEELHAFSEEAMAGDYDNLLATCARWVKVR